MTAAGAMRQRLGGVDAGAVVPAGLTFLTEGAWIAVIYALLEATRGEALALGPLSFGVAAAAGWFAALEGRRRLGPRWPMAAVALVAGATVLGWLAGPETRALLGAGDLGAALSAHPGGWLLGLAFLRGVRQIRDRTDDPVGGSLLAVGVPVIASAFVFSGALAASAQAVFRDAAAGDTLLFVGAGLVGLPLARLRLIGTAAGPGRPLILDWRRNPAWIGLLLALVAVMLLVAIPGSFALGPVVTLVIAALPVPLFVASLFVGINRRFAVAFLLTIAMAVGIFFVLRALPEFRSPAPQVGSSGGLPALRDGLQFLTTVVGGLVILAGIAILVGFLAAVWMRRGQIEPDEDLGEERAIDFGPAADGRPWWRRVAVSRRRSGVPLDAAQAYLAAVAAMDARPDMRRWPSETPAEHARRMRALPAGEARPPAGDGSRVPGLLSRLAADYELMRFGGRRLSAGEHRRALGRWESIRVAIRHSPARGRPGRQGRHERPEGPEVPGQPLG